MYIQTDTGAMPVGPVVRVFRLPRASTSRVTFNKRRKYIRKILFESQDKCYYCGCRVHEREKDLLPIAAIDHKTPLSRGGTNCIDNLVLSCEKCNGEKGNLTAEEYLASKSKGGY